MTKDEIHHRARNMLSELLELDTLATSEGQRRNFKEAREYLARAAKNGAEADLRVGSYWLAVVSGQIRSVQDGKRKGELRAARRTDNGGGSA